MNFPNIFNLIPGVDFSPVGPRDDSAGCDLSRNQIDGSTTKGPANVSAGPLSSSPPLSLKKKGVGYPKENFKPNKSYFCHDCGSIDVVFLEQTRKNLALCKDCKLKRAQNETQPKKTGGLDPNPDSGSDNAKRAVQMTNRPSFAFMSLK